MSIVRGVLGGALCLAGVQLARGLKLAPADSEDVYCRDFEREPQYVGREASTRSATEIYQFSPDQRTASDTFDLVLAEDNSVIGEMRSVARRSCNGCLSFRRKACRRYTGLCLKLAEPTTPRGVCDLWAARK